MSSIKKFVEVITSDEDSDVEVVFVPYVKPPPPVIDLLISSDDDEQVSKSGGSKKNKRRNKSKNYLTDEQTNDSTSNASSRSTTSRNGEKSSTKTIAVETRVPPTSPGAVNVGRPEHLLIHAVRTPVRDVNDQDRETDGSLNAGQIGAGHNQSLRNGGVSSSLSENDDSIHQTHVLTSRESLPGTIRASSVFEFNNDALGEPAMPFSMLAGTNTAVAGTVERIAAVSVQQNAGEVGNGTSPMVGGNGWVLPQIPCRQAKKVSPSKRNRIPAPNSDLVTLLVNPLASVPTPPTPRKRVSKQQKARQRTNEEINNFLTTLGIFEPNETPPSPPPKRIRKSRARNPLSVSEIPLLPETEALTLPLVPPPPSISEPESIPSDIPIPTPTLPVQVPTTSVTLEEQIETTTTTIPPSKRIRKSRARNPLSVSEIPLPPETQALALALDSISEPESIPLDTPTLPVLVRTTSVTLKEQSEATTTTISPPKRIRKSRARNPLSVLEIPLPPETQALAPSLVPPPPSISEPESIPLNIPIPTLPVLVRTTSVARKEQSEATTTATPPLEFQQPNYAPEVVTTNKITPEETIHLNRSRFLNITPEIGILTRTERAALSFNISSVLNSGSVLAPDQFPQRKSSSDPPEAPPQNDIPASINVPKSSTQTEPDRQRRSTPISTLGEPSADPDPISIVSTMENLNISTGHEQGGPRPSYLPSRWTPEMVKFYDCFSKEDMRLSNVLSKMPDDPELWKTDEWKFKKPKINKRMRCVNCNQFGHLRWKCKEKRKKPVCYLCGEEGHGGIRHDRDREPGSNRRCPNAVCLNCGRKQSNTTSGCSNCVLTRTPLKCNICGIVGHSTFHCPDKWRRFFSTTTTNFNQEDGTVQYYGDRPVYRKHKDSYCANCGQGGHTFFHCRCKPGSKYTRQNPRILEELPRIPKQIPASLVLSNVYQDTSSAIAPNDNDTEQNCTTTTTRKSNAVVEDDVIEVVFTGGNNSFSTNKCMDPECYNKLKNKSFCFEMMVEPKEHKLMLKAQEENKISPSMKQTDQVSVLQSRNAVHIYVDDVVRGQVEVLTLIAKLKMEARNSKKANTPAPKRNSNLSPEVITLEDDDVEAATTDKKLTVALLESEWDLIFTESLKPNGLISRLTEKFKVSIYVSKENLTVTIENGDEENKRLAQKNIVFWLECQSANVEFVLQVRLENNEIQTLTPITPSWSKKKKRPSQSPRPQSKKFKKRRLDNPNYVPNPNHSDLVPNSSLNNFQPPPTLVPNSSQNQNNFQLPRPAQRNFGQSGPGGKKSRWDTPPDQHSLRSTMPRDRELDRGRSRPGGTRWDNMGQGNPDEIRYFNSQQTPFQNDGHGFLNDYSERQNDFNPSFRNNYPQEQPQDRWPPQDQDYVPFRFNSHGRFDDGYRGDGGGHRQGGGSGHRRGNGGGHGLGEGGGPGHRRGGSGGHWRRSRGGHGRGNGNGNHRDNQNPTGYTSEKNLLRYYSTNIKIRPS